MARMYSGSSDSGGSYGSPGERSNSQARTYTCKICGNEFNSGQSLGGHMNVHRGKEARNGQCSRSSTPPAAGDYNSTSNNSASTFKGVRYRSEQHKWVAEIRPPKSTKTWWLGTYSTPVEAAYAYDVAIMYFGSETSLNFDGHPIYDQIPRISPSLPKQDFAVQLRKVVKEYGKLAMQSGGLQSGMQSHHSKEEEDDDEEDEASTSYNGANEDQYNNDSPYQQQEEYALTRDVADFDLDGIPDSFPEGQAESFHHDTPFDFEMAVPVTFEPAGYNYSTGNYQTAASDYAQCGVYNDYQLASEYETNGYYNQVLPPASEYEPNENNYNQMSPAAMSSDYGYIFNGHQPHQQFRSPFQYNCY